MKKLKFLSNVVAVIFISVAIVSCSSSNKGNEYYDIDTVTSETEEEAEETNVDRYCGLLNDMTESLSEATSQLEFEKIVDEKYESRYQEFTKDISPLTAEDKEKVTSALESFYGTLLDKSAEFADKPINEETRTEVFNNIKGIVEKSTTIAMLCSYSDEIIE